MVDTTVKQQKKHIYLHMFHIGMIHLKLILAQPIYKLIFDKRRVYISEFLHLIPTRLYTEDIDSSDYDFVNSMLEYFIRVYPDWNDPQFLSMMDAGLDLYDLVANDFDINWDFPQKLKQVIEKQRKNVRDDDLVRCQD